MPHLALRIAASVMLLCLCQTAQAQELPAEHTGRGARANGVRLDTVNELVECAVRFQLASTCLASDPSPEAESSRAIYQDMTQRSSEIIKKLNPPRDFLATLFVLRAHELAKETKSSCTNKASVAKRLKEVCIPAVLNPEERRMHWERVNREAYPR